MPGIQLSSSVSAASERARERLLSFPGEPLFIADWTEVLMIHLQVERDCLQRVIPFALDLHEGEAYMTLVAFTMRQMRPRLGGKFGAWLLNPIASHRFLNVRTYVRHAKEPGIYFMTEWLSSRLSVALGPPVFGLPYRYGKLVYRHDALMRGDAGEAEATGFVENGPGDGRFSYRAARLSGAQFTGCEPRSLDHWLMERYTAFTHHRGRSRFFRVWHAPWVQTPVRARIVENDLLLRRWPLLAGAELAGANYSPGAYNVWMGRPHRI
jgi:uncharacterized protein YqjF (DUF2071 family)